MGPFLELLHPRWRNLERRDVWESLCWRFLILCWLEFMPGDRVWSVGHGIKIQVDYFHGTADAFFLTHCHADHISGLKAGKNR